MMAGNQSDTRSVPETKQEHNSFSLPVVAGGPIGNTHRGRKSPHQRAYSTEQLVTISAARDRLRELLRVSEWRPGTSRPDLARAFLLKNAARIEAAYRGKT